jgi:hypothetical protein
MALATPPPGASKIIDVLREWRVEPGADVGGAWEARTQEGMPSLEVDTRDCWLGATPTNGESRRRNARGY